MRLEVWAKIMDAADGNVDELVSSRKVLNHIRAAAMRDTKKAFKRREAPDVVATTGRTKHLSAYAGKPWAPLKAITRRSKHRQQASPKGPLNVTGRMIQKITYTIRETSHEVYIHGGGYKPDRSGLRRRSLHDVHNEGFTHRSGYEVPPRPFAGINYSTIGGLTSWIQRLVGKALLSEGLFKNV